MKTCYIPTVILLPFLAEKLTWKRCNVLSIPAVSTTCDVGWNWTEVNLAWKENVKIQLSGRKATFFICWIILPVHFDLGNPMTQFGVTTCKSLHWACMNFIKMFSKMILSFMARCFSLLIGLYQGNKSDISLLICKLSTSGRYHFLPPANGKVISPAGAFTKSAMFST